MKPVDFEGSNLKLGEGQPQYETLPVLFEPEKEGQPITCCFHLEGHEVKEILETGLVWINQWTFGNPFHPILLTTTRPQDLDAEIQKFPATVITEINHICSVLPEGRLLMAALAMITTMEGFTDKTPEQVINIIHTIANKMFQ